MSSHSTWVFEELGEQVCRCQKRLFCSLLLRLRVMSFVRPARDTSLKISVPLRRSLPYSDRARQLERRTSDGPFFKARADLFVGWRTSDLCKILEFKSRGEILMGVVGASCSSHGVPSSSPGCDCCNKVTRELVFLHSKVSRFCKGVCNSLSTKGRPRNHQAL